MSSGILSNDSMMYNYSENKLPWHGLGNPITGIDLRNIGTVRKAAGLDWRVEAHTPIVEINGERIQLNDTQLDQFGNVTKNDGFRALIRTDDNTVLSVVKGRYHVQQNDVVLDMAASINEVGDVEFETAGSLRGGRTVWALAKLGSDPRLDGLGIERYILVAKSHDGSSPITVIPTDVRVVCSNTMALARKGEALFKIRHTANASVRIEEAKAALGAMYSAHDEMSDAILHMVDTTITNGKFEDIIKQLVGDPEAANSPKGKTQATNRAAQLRASWELSENDGIRGTAMGVVNAANDVDLWMSTIRSSELPTRAEMQMNGVLKNYQPLTHRAMELLGV